jgi:hypothetical protein
MGWSSAGIGIVALTFGLPAFVATDAPDSCQPNTRRAVFGGPSAPAPPDVETPMKRLPLRIANVRLEPAPSADTPSAVLKFQMTNIGSRTLTNAVFLISVVKECGCEEDRQGDVLVGPLRAHAKLVIEPGYRAEYEVLVHA